MTAIVASAIIFASIGSAAVETAVRDATLPFDPGRVAISGLLGDRLRAHQVGRIMAIDEDVLLNGFRKKPGTHPWIGEHVGKWLHAACLLCRWSKDGVLREKIDRVAKGLMAAQEKDGYLGTYVPGKRFGLFPEADWDVWSHKYCLIGLLSYHDLSGDAEALAACRRAGDLLRSVFPKERSILAAGTHVGMAATSVLEPIVLLHRATGDKNYLDFAEYIVRSWDEEKGPRVLSAMLESKTVLAVGNRKAYEMLSNYVGLCELYRATGKRDYLRAAELAWEDTNAKRLYITGGASSGEHFQPDGHLPHGEDAHIQEMCVTTTWTQLCLELLRLTGEERYVEALERTLFNQVLGAQNPDGSGFCYFVPLMGRKPLRPDYPGKSGMDCCNSSGPRALALAPTYLGTADAEGFRINLHAPARWAFEHEGVPITITLGGRFPSEDAAEIAVAPERPVAMTLALRIPRWAQRPAVVIDGDVHRPDGGAYLKIKRTWTKGDRIECSFPFRIEVHKGTGTNEGLYAVTAGPLVLAFDQADNPEVKLVQQVALPSLNAGELDFKRIQVPGKRSWGGEVALSCKVRDLARSARKEEGADFRGILRPFASAGSWGSRYSVWLRGPDAVLEGDALSPFAFGREFASKEGNVAGSIADGDPGSYRVTFDGTAQSEAFFGISVDQPVTISRAVYVAGNIFHDGGWFDTAGGKPRLHIKRSAEGAWEDIAVFEDYPAATATDAKGVRPGTRFTATFKPVPAIAIRVIGKPACGDNAAQAFASCAELAAFEK